MGRIFHLYEKKGVDNSGYVIWWQFFLSPERLDRFKKGEPIIYESSAGYKEVYTFERMFLDHVAVITRSRSGGTQVEETEEILCYLVEREVLE